MDVHIMTFGASLRIKDGLFEVLTPQPPDGKTFFRHEYAVSHIKSIWVHSAVSISSAALRLAIENDIDFVLCDHHGMPLGRFTPHRPNTTAAVQKAQLIISQTPHAITYVKEWVTAKLTHQATFLREIGSRRKSSDIQKVCKTAAKKIEDIVLKIKALEGKHISDIADVLRGMEGASGRIYFDTLKAALPKYYQFEGRTRQPAEDLFNAFLNYGYAILYNRVEIAVTKAGLNPFLGFLHRDEFGGFRAFVFDAIEPYRIEIERIVFKLFSGKQVSYEQHGAVAQTDKSGIWLSGDGKKLIAARFAESFDNWHTKLTTSMQHTAATMRKHLSAQHTEDITEPLHVLPHVFG